MRWHATSSAVAIVEKMGPLRGDGNDFVRGFQCVYRYHRREDGSPSWGRKPEQRISLKTRG